MRTVGKVIGAVVWAFGDRRTRWTMWFAAAVMTWDCFVALAWFPHGGMLAATLVGVPSFALTVWFFRKFREIVREIETPPELEYDPETDPMTLAVNRAFNTGEPVYSTEGQPLPEPGGPIKPIHEDSR